MATKKHLVRNVLVMLSVLTIRGSGATCSAALLDPTNPLTPIAQFVTPLVIPPVMPPAKRSAASTKYEIAARQFRQQILPAPYGPTTVWGYGPAGGPATSFHSPSFTFEVQQCECVYVTWINDLVDGTGAFLPHLLPVDQTLRWANPPGPPDTRGLDPAPYRGPVPLVTHVHGSHVKSNSDGNPQAWYLPDARNIPDGFFTRGTHYGTAAPAPEGAAVFQYPNDQPATTLWYHDHAMGMTRLNVYAGLAGFWLLRDKCESSLKLPGPAPKLGDPPGTKYYEIPLAIQDRSFQTTGELFYPDNRAFFEGLNQPGAPPQFPGQGVLAIPFIPDPACAGKPSDIAPIWNPEFFGNTIMVNGRTWPYLEVEKRRYRFRIVNGSDARFLILKLDNGLPFYQIGAEGGFLPEVVLLDQLLLGPAERADVIVDFTGVKSGTSIILQNIGPDVPFNGMPFEPAHPATTGRVMMFRVVPAKGPDTSTPPNKLQLPAPEELGKTTNTRHVSLNELDSESVFVRALPDGSITLDCANGVPFGPQVILLGTVVKGINTPLPFDADITENPALDSVEEWVIHNYTADAHPIHLHLVLFEVLERVTNDGLPGGVSRPPEPWETGRKDTVVAYPGEATRIKAKFDVAGLYVWHCHLLEHEDNEMMRPYFVGPRPTSTCP
jgi:spore coat protein A, manganese oxidase